MITNFEIFNKPVNNLTNKVIQQHINYADVIHLDYDQSVFSFHFAALDYTMPEKNEYAYKLENFDLEWNFAENRRFASYTNIKPGKYTFRVKGTNNDGIWNEKGTSVQLVITPPFWRTYWFYGLEIALGIFILVSFVRFRVRKLQYDKKILEQKVYERTEEISKQKKELEKAYLEVKKSSRLKEIFLANTSHEIRTPLNVILGFTNLLFNTSMDKKQNTYLENIKKSGENLMVVINDILTFSKIEAGKLDIERKNFKFHEFMDNFFSVMQVKANERQINLKKDIDRMIPDMVYGDQVRLNQILTNLVDNAIKFTNPGGFVAINIKTKENNQTSFVAEFKIMDNGIGIAAEHQEKIFESFTQAKNDTSRKYGGTGLGLSIVKRLIELQGGQIKLDSAPNKGSVFTFTIPFKKEISQKSIKKTKKQVKPFYDHKDKDFILLLVEDNPVNASLAIDTIKLFNENITIDCAENGKEAIQMLDKKNYDLVIMDVQMPEMDGYEATKYIRTEISSQKRKIPILGMSAHAMKEEKEKCLQLGMNDYITKPFVPEELFEKIIALTGNQSIIESSNIKKENFIIFIK